MRILCGFTVAASGTVWQSNCVLELPNSVSVNPRPVVVDGDNDDDDCIAIVCD